MVCWRAATPQICEGPARERGPDLRHEANLPDWLGADLRFAERSQFARLAGGRPLFCETKPIGQVGWRADLRFAKRSQFARLAGGRPPFCETKPICRIGCGPISVLRNEANLPDWLEGRSPFCETKPICRIGWRVESCYRGRRMIRFSKTYWPFRHTFRAYVGGP